MQKSLIKYEYKINTKAPGTLHYMPPEALEEFSHYDTSMDTYS